MVTARSARSLRAPRRTSRAALVLALALAGLAMASCRSGPPPTLVERGDAAWAAGEYDAADALYREALVRNPGEARALHGRARVALAKRDPERALEIHAALARADRAYWQSAARDDYANALFEAGERRLRKGKPGDAVKVLRLSRKLAPDRSGLSRVLARALTEHAAQLAMHGRRAPALALYNEAIEVAPNEIVAYVGAAEILIATGKKKEALGLLEIARQYGPTDSRVRALTMEAMGLY